MYIIENIDKEQINCRNYFPIICLREKLWRCWWRPSVLYVVDAVRCWHVVSRPNDQCVGSMLYRCHLGPPWIPTLQCILCNINQSGILLCMRPANERRRYNVTSSLIGWAHPQNDPWSMAEYKTGNSSALAKYVPWNTHTVSSFNCHILQGCFPVTGTIILLPQCQ